MILLCYLLGGASLSGGGGGGGGEMTEGSHYIHFKSKENNHELVRVDDGPVFEWGWGTNQILLDGKSVMEKGVADAKWYNLKL